MFNKPKIKQILISWQKVLQIFYISQAPDRMDAINSYSSKEEEQKIDNLQVNQKEQQQTLTSAEQSIKNRNIFLSNHRLSQLEELLNGKKVLEEYNVQLGNFVGGGSTWDVYDVYTLGTKNYKEETKLAIKVLKTTSQQSDDAAKADMENSKGILNFIKFSVKNDDFATAQALENCAISIRSIDIGSKHAVIVPKVRGDNGLDFFLNGHKIGAPIQGVINDTVSCNSYMTNKKKSLSVARQIASIARAFYDAGYIYNVDLSNIIVDNKNRVFITNFESIKKLDKKTEIGNQSCTPETPGDNDCKSDTASQKSVVFYEAMNLPFILFGAMAYRYFWQFFGHDAPDTVFADQKEFLAFFHSSCLKSSIQVPYFKLPENSEKVLEDFLVRLYSINKIEQPVFDKSLSEEQELRYTYFHFGYNYMQSKLDELRFGAKYHKDVVNSLALLMAMATEPDDKKRISIREYEEILLNLELTCDQWKDGQFRITEPNTQNGTWKDTVTTGSLVDMILPKNKLSEK